MSTLKENIDQVIHSHTYIYVYIRIYKLLARSTSLCSVQEACVFVVLVLVIKPLWLNLGGIQPSVSGLYLP